MSAPSFNYFYRVDVTVAQIGQTIQSGTTTVRELVTRTYKFVNKELRDATTPSDRETYIPVLRSVGEVTLNSGEFLPTTSFSSITIDDSRGSFGADRKFSDILERFTVIDQPIAFYVGESDNITDAPTSWTQIGSGKIVAWNRAINSNEPTVSFQIAPFKISDRIMNLEVSRDVIGMENAPEANLGKALPIVFSKPNTSQTTQLDRYPQVIPTRVSADGASTAKYALATHMYQLTQGRVASNYYVKKTWEDGADIWASVHATRAPDDYTGSPTGSYYTLNTYASTAYRLPQITATNNETGFITTGVQFRCRGQGSTSRTSNAFLDVFMLQVDKVTRAVIGELSRGRIALSAYDSSNNTSGSDFSIKANFDAPVVVELISARNYDFYIGWEVTGYDAAGDLAFYQNSTTSLRMIKSSTISANDSYSGWKISDDSTGIVAHKLLTVTATLNNHENTYTKDGLTYSSITLSQPASDSGQSNPHLDSIELVALMEGFDTYSVSSPVRCVTPVTIAERLSYSWNGEAWVNENALDTTTLQTSHYDKLFAANQSHRARYVSGVIENKSTYGQVMTELARGSACKVGVLANEKLFIYPWGITADPAFVIPQADIIPLSWEVRDSSTIINRTQISFDKAYATSIAQDSTEGYKYSIDYSDATYLPSQAITEESRTLYGVQNVVENSFNVFGYSDYYLNVGLPGYLTGGISNSQPNDGSNVIYSVDFLADYYMSRNSLPATYCSFVVPFHRYKTIRMFDVINFAHSEFPAFYGTDPNARPGVVDNGSTVTPVVNAGYGQELTRAEPYRGLVEAVSYVMAIEHAPAIRLTVLVLLNREYDPT